MMLMTGRTDLPKRSILIRNMSPDSLGQVDPGLYTEHRMAPLSPVTALPRRLGSDFDRSQVGELTNW